MKTDSRWNEKLIVIIIIIIIIIVISIIISEITRLTPRPPSLTIFKHTSTKPQAGKLG